MMENIMTNEAVEETGDVSVDDVLAAIQQKNLAQAKNHFAELMSTKVDAALGSEKIKIANSVFNDARELEAELEAEEESEELDVESEESDYEDIDTEIQQAFEEEGVE
jgi:hypothetical protein